MGALDTLMSGSAPAYKFEKVGDRIKGQIVALDERQDADFQDPTKLKWWNREDGPARGNPADRPKMIVIITLQTELSDGTGEDDGQRTIWCRGNLHSAVKKALQKELGPKPMERDVIGGTLRILHHALGSPPQRGMAAPKLFEAKFERKPVMADDDDHANGAAGEPDGRPSPPPSMEW